MSNSLKSCAPSTQANKWNFIKHKKTFESFFLFPLLQSICYPKYHIKFTKFLYRIIIYVFNSKHYIKLFNNIY